jgi:hypothetical protein
MAHWLRGSRLPTTGVLLSTKAFVPASHAVCHDQLRLLLGDHVGCLKRRFIGAGGSDPPFPTPPHPLYPRVPLPLSPRSAPCPIFRLAIRTTVRTSRRGRTITRGIAPLSPSGSRISQRGGLGGVFVGLPLRYLRPGIRLCRTRRGRRSWPMSGCFAGGEAFSPLPFTGGARDLVSGANLVAAGWAFRPSAARAHLQSRYPPRPPSRG